MTRIANAEGLARQVASLAALDSATLKARWRVLYGIDPPAHVSRGLLIRAIAYRLQENALGGLSAQARRALAHAAEAAMGGHADTAPVLRLAPGTRLVREWHGVTHQVLALEDGVLYRDRHYRSLSEVARLITGGRRSGPLFFGLKPRGSKADYG